MPRTKGSKNKKKAAVVAAMTLDETTAKIAAVESEIDELSAQLKDKKAELKSLVKAKEEAEKAEAEKKAEENKAAVWAAVEASGKSIEEILGMLQNN